jgi:hypothetical protein
MRIAFVSTDFYKDPKLDLPTPNGSAFYRCYLPMYSLKADASFGLPAWTAERGFGVKVNEKEATFGFDTVMLKQMMGRWVPHQIKVAKSLGQRIIVDVDDLYDDIDDSNLAKYQTSSEYNNAINRDHYRESILLADTVTVSTPYLQLHYSQFHPDVRLVRNGCLPTNFIPRPVRRKKPVIGWVGAVPWRGNDIPPLSEWLPDFLEEHDLMFHHAGHVDAMKPFGELAGINPERMIYSPMVTFDNYSSLFTFDIGIVPLANSPFNHSKSTAKGFEYACAGIPFVAQNLPEYQRLSNLGVGRVADTPAEWVKQLTCLLDFSTRKKDSRTNFSNVVNEHTILNRAKEWREVFNV